MSNNEHIFASLLQPLSTTKYCAQCYISMLQVYHSTKKFYSPTPILLKQLFVLISTFYSSQKQYREHISTLQVYHSIKKVYSPTSNLLKCMFVLILLFPSSQKPGKTQLCNEPHPSKCKGHLKFLQVTPYSIITVNMPPIFGRYSKSKLPQGRHIISSIPRNI